MDIEFKLWLHAFVKDISAFVKDISNPVKERKYFSENFRLVLGVYPFAFPQIY